MTPGMRGSSAFLMPTDIMYRTADKYAQGSGGGSMDARHAGQHKVPTNLIVFTEITYYTANKYAKGSWGARPHIALNAHAYA